jgi:uncharacterized repeat protein (TIGR03803 family)
VKLKIISCVAMLLGAISGAPLSAFAAYTELDAFTSGSSGANSFGPLIADKSGDLFGTSSAGGNGGCVRYASTGCGTVFELTPPGAPDGPWTETILYRFPGGNGPSLPVAGLSMDVAGDLFGMTTDGDVYGCTTSYCGTAFELTPPAKPGHPWKAIILYRFSQGAGGFNPGSGLILDGAGNLYGTTQTYGPNYHGTVFRLSPPADRRGWWTETVLSGFDRGGLWPIGNVVFDKAGNLYGTTFNGGSQNFGVVFQLTPKAHGYWTENVLYEFGQNACSPKTNLIIDGSGNLYGTAQGCPALSGAVFELTRPKHEGAWTESVLAYFRGTSNYDPTTSLTFDEAGNLYGTTASGGTYGRGSVFQLMRPSWTETVLHSFSWRDGNFPTSGPIFGLGGALYGTTLNGGYRRGICKTAGGCGVVYRITP